MSSFCASAAPSRGINVHGVILSVNRLPSPGDEDPQGLEDININHGTVDLWRSGDRRKAVFLWSFPVDRKKFIDAMVQNCKYKRSADSRRQHGFSERFFQSVRVSTEDLVHLQTHSVVNLVIT